ncbi:MAG: hypothetical protein DRK00_05505 [Thermoprotei archaeon]|nr:MAG: hypothetical protein DRK00_05505 [Thermoprotei archaeon]
MLKLGGVRDGGGGEEGLRVVVEPLGEREVVESYSVWGEVARVAIVREGAKMRYFVLEEPLSASERRVLDKVIGRLRQKLVSRRVGGEWSGSLVELAKAEAERLLKGLSVNVERVLYYLQRDYLGYGPVHVMVLDPNLEDISCNGVGIPVYVWHRKYESLETNVTIMDREYLRSLIRSIAAKCGRHISAAFPTLDATMPEGYRFAATLDEVSARGSSFTIRKFREKPLTIVELIRDGVIDSRLAAFFWLMIESKRTFMIIGATGSGKTTLLNALLTFIPPDMKVCTVEETREINLPIKNWVPLVARKSYAVGESVGEVSLFDLVKVTLRYRPDYIVVGEVRGEEAYVLFQAMQSVSHDTPILVREEEGRVTLVKIGEFVDRFYAEGEEGVAKPVTGYYVLSHEGYNVVWKPIRYVLRHSASEVYEVEYEGGGRLEATGSHSVFILDPETLEVVEKPVSLVKPGDYLLTFVKRDRRGMLEVIDVIEVMGGRVGGMYVDSLPQRARDIAGRNPVPLREFLELERRMGGDIREGVALRLERSWCSLPASMPLDEELAFVFGAYVACGYVERSGSSIVFSFSKNEGELARRVADILYRKFGVKPVVYSQGGYMRYEYHHALLAELFTELLGTRLEERRVPPQLWTSRCSVVRAFFKGLGADAWRKARSRYTAFSTTNRDLAYQLAWLARLAGLYSNVWTTRGYGESRDGMNYVVVYLNDERRRESVLDERVPLRPILKLIEMVRPEALPLKFIYAKRREFISKRTALEILKWLRKRGSWSVEALTYLDRVERLIHGEIIAVRVERVGRKPYAGYVYDISVPGTESFMGGVPPVLLHNSGHGGTSTMHAETLEGMLNRLTSKPMEIPEHMIPTLNFVIHISRLKRGGRVVRRVTRVWEVRGVGEFREIASWNPVTDEFEHKFQNSKILALIAKRQGVSVEEALSEVERRRALLDYLASRGVVDYEEIARWVYRYYENPSATLAEVGASMSTKIPGYAATRREGRPVVSRRALERGRRESSEIKGFEEVFSQLMTLLEKGVEEERAEASEGVGESVEFSDVLEEFKARLRGRKDLEVEH